MRAAQVIAEQIQHRIFKAIFLEYNDPVMLVKSLILGDFFETIDRNYYLQIYLGLIPFKALLIDFS